MAVVPRVRAPGKERQQGAEEPPEDRRGAPIARLRLLEQALGELIAQSGKRRGVAVETLQRVMSLDVDLRQGARKALAEALRRLAADDCGEERMRAVTPPDQQLAEPHGIDLASGVVR